MKKEFFNACQHDCPDNCAMISTVEDGKVISVKGRKDHPFTLGVQWHPEMLDCDLHFKIYKR